jgi:hypothetical protein
MRHFPYEDMLFKGRHYRRPGTVFMQEIVLFFCAGTSIALRRTTRCHVEKNMYANLYAWTSSVL